MEITLGDFLKYLVLILQEKEVTLPMQEEYLWHDLFYKLKKDESYKGKKPDFIRNIMFNWDEKYPESNKISHLLNSLHTNACISASNPKYDTMTMSNEIAEKLRPELSKIDEDLREYIDYASSKAKAQFAGLVTNHA